MTAGTTNFPTSLDSHTGASPLGFGEVNNQAYTLSTASHTAAVTTLTVASTSLFPSKGYLIVKREIISYTGTTATTFTGCTRGVGGTTAAAFLSGTLVEQVPVAANHNDLAAALVAVENELISRRQPTAIINGNYDYWQRGTAARTATTTYSIDTSYAADRMFTLPSGASVTVQRSTTVPDTKSSYSALITGASSVTTVDHGQRIRAGIVNTNLLRSLVFSCYVRNVSGAAFTPNLRIGTPASSDDFTTVTNRLDQALQSCADSAWTRVYHVFDPSAYTNIANGMEVCLRVPSGSLVSGDTVYVSQFDLRPGIALAPYTPPDPETELSLCKRYYEKSYGLTTTPGTATQAGAAIAILSDNNNIKISLITHKYSVEKRGSPTVTFYDEAGNSGKITTYPAAGTPATNNVTPSVGLGGTPDTTGFGMVHLDTIAGASYHWTANAEL